MRILLIEDDHKISTAIKQGLELESFAVDTEYDADAGLGAALAEEHDLIILDRMLPGSMEGVDVCKEIRSEGIHTPILLLTAKDEIRDRVAGLNAGADDYLPKPFAFEELLARIRALLRRPQDSLGTTLAYDDLVLDTVSYEVTRAGGTINLSRREFALLEYLLRNAGKLLTKESIIKHVWNFDADILPNTVEVYVGYLRNKIDKPFAGEPLLTTVRGYGYRLGTKKK
ncbi:MAG TPA: response regulator transcription factor [Candidatus Saccharimonadales bacterium]|nr:response regulator transcription factor [Candidatus Saccharimonadales bacterium]